MEPTITIFCKNTGAYHDVPRGISLIELKDQLGIQLKYPIIAAHVNYKVENLNFLMYKPKDVEFLDASSPTGMRVYVRTLNMVLACAIHELYPSMDLRIEHPISKGYYCTLQWHSHSEDTQHNSPVVTADMVAAIKQRMQQIIAEDRPIYEEEKRTKDVIKMFASQYNKGTIFETLGNPYCRYFRMGDFIDYYTNVLLPSSGYINVFDLELFQDGMLLRIPNRENPTILEDAIQQDKMFSIFCEYSRWNKLLHIHNVTDFNIACKRNKSFEMIKLAEALHEKKVAQIADAIAEKRPKMIFVSGPSSSGKTTFSKRLQIQLMVNGIKPEVLSMDDYFVNRVDTPVDENGEWDFENVKAVDLPFFRQQMQELLEGKEVELPTYDFSIGERVFEGRKLKLQKDSILLIEGLHALNPCILPDVDRSLTFKIYVSALTTINIDNHNWIPTTDIRLLRRVVRDYKYRNFSARETIARCPSVVRGEMKWVYPYQEEADVMFNSALIFEFAVLKRHAEPILQEVPKYCEEYSEAHRLLKFLQYFVPIPEKEIPPTSLLREFVGGSSFHY
ncbi:MAG: nucleoside kinase [Paludibacteraceae bacterium]|jgi:uridine kinase|nr:nucleoside kinase [Paludibacteraceae bacterium]MEE1070740.1 nucleoside kinase [Paludibacteraceae bacterium]MEE1096210.1 nucleoside kinase [Paludibacteraceae bacterium]